MFVWLAQSSLFVVVYFPTFFWQYYTHLPCMRGLYRKIWSRHISYFELSIYDPTMLGAEGFTKQTFRTWQIIKFSLERRTRTCSYKQNKTKVKEEIYSPILFLTLKKLPVWFILPLFVLFSFFLSQTFYNHFFFNFSLLFFYSNLKSKQFILFGLFSFYFIFFLFSILQQFLYSFIPNLFKFKNSQLYFTLFICSKCITFLI